MAQSLKFTPIFGIYTNFQNLHQQPYTATWHVGRAARSATLHVGRAAEPGCNEHTSGTATLDVGRAATLRGPTLESTMTPIKILATARHDAFPFKFSKSLAMAAGKRKACSDTITMS